MAFPETVVFEAWLRAKGRCECISPEGERSVKCGRWLRISERGKKTDGAWEAVAQSPSGPQDLENCRIFCRACIQKLALQKA